MVYIFPLSIDLHAYSTFIAFHSDWLVQKDLDKRNTPWANSIFSPPPTGPSHWPTATAENLTDSLRGDTWKSLFVLWSWQWWTYRLMSQSSELETTTFQSMRLKSLRLIPGR